MYQRLPLERGIFCLSDLLLRKKLESKIAFCSNKALTMRSALVHFSQGSILKVSISIVAGESRYSAWHVWG